MTVWQVPGFHQLATFWCANDLVALFFLDDGGRVACAGGGRIDVFEAVSSWQTFRATVIGQITALASKQNYAIAGTDEGKIWIWDLDRGALLASSRSSRAAISALSVSPRARRAAAGDESGTITVFGW